METKKGPDWNHWRIIDQWTIGEATCLLLNIDPESSLGGDIIKTRFDLQWDRSTVQQRVLKEAKRIWDLAWASKKSGKLSWSRHLSSTEAGLPYLAPADWITWAASKNISIPEELKPLLREHSGSVRKAHWLVQDVWSEGEFADLLCGLEPNSNRENFDELNQARDAIRRAASVGAVLKPRDISDPDWGSKLYLRDRFFTLAEAIHWATSKPGRFPKFPFDSSDLPTIESKTPSAISQPIDEPLGTKERTTLLVIIGALASELAIDILKPSKAASTIEAMTQKLGISLTDRAIENHLRAVPEALDKRSK